MSGTNVTAALTSEDRTRLVSALSSAVLVAPKARSVEEGLFFQIITLRDSPESALKELKELLEVVRSIPAFDLFNHAYQCALGRWERIDFLFLVRWLVSRGQQVGPERAVADLSRYLEVETLDLTEVLAVDGFQIETTIDLGEHQLVPWKDLGVSDTKWRVAAHSLFSHASASAAVSRRHVIQRLHIRPWDSPAPNIPLSIEPALDVLRCVTVVAGAGIRLLHYWFEPPDWAPWAVSLSSFGIDLTAYALPVALKADLVPQIQHCVSRFGERDDSTRVRLRVPVDRLNRSYLAGLRSVEKAIELGVALESLYAPAKLSEGIAFAVRMRAARFLGGPLDARRKTAAILKDVYDLRSRAVHAGRFDTEGGPKKWRDPNVVLEVLQEGQCVVARSLVKVIEEGEPAWADFDIA